MPANPGTDFSGLLRAACSRRAVLAMTLLPAAGDALCQRLGLECGPEARQALAKRLEALGVGEVFWGDGLAEAQIQEEAGELVRRLESGCGLPLLLSGCSAWYRSVERELAPYFSVLPPHMRCRGLALRSLLSARRGASFSQIVHVTVVGCAAQKERYQRFQDDPALWVGEEYVITARELALWLGLAAALPVVQAPQEPTGAGNASPGRLPLVLGEACRMLHGDAPSFPMAPLPELPVLRGGVVRLGHRELRYAQARGLHEAPRLLEWLQSGQGRVDLLEVLACAGCR